MKISHYDTSSPGPFKIQKEVSTGGTAAIKDNRPATLYQRQLQDKMNGSSTHEALPLQRRENQTSIQDHMESGMETTTLLQETQTTAFKPSNTIQLFIDPQTAANIRAQLGTNNPRNNTIDQARFNAMIGQRIVDFRNKVFDNVSFNGVNLRNLDLRRTDLRTTDIANQQQYLPGLDLSETILDGLDFDGADLTHTNFSGALLRNVSFYNTILNRANFRNARLDVETLWTSCRSFNNGTLTFNPRRVQWFADAIFPMQNFDARFAGFLSNAILPNANFRDSTFDPRIDLSGANLRGANLTGADLSNVNLRGLDLQNANLSRADFTGADLTGADLSAANLTGADFSGADLTRANLFGVDFGLTILVGTIFTQSTLSWAVFQGKNLGGLDFSHANFMRADLARANVTGANFFGADFRWANLNGADFSRATLPTRFRGALARGGMRLVRGQGTISLDQSKFHGASMLGTDFRGAQITNAHIGAFQPVDPASRTFLRNAGAFA
ncbi:MAG: pentapeptide repeat-containing protein [Cytophagales bacterium]|nr:pentapeptide repeat-containing protein [Cytophagales bacterium]